MPDRSATAISCPNIAFIKYWGDRDPVLHLPANSSLSMNLDGLITRTRLTFDEQLTADQLSLNSQLASGSTLERVSALLDRVRLRAGLRQYARVESGNNFPMGAGIASSASAFAALALAAWTAAGLEYDPAALSRLARTGSGSACRSIPGGFVEWQMGTSDEDSYAVSIAPPGHWDLVDCIVVISETHKLTGSEKGHALAGTSPLQQARLEGASQRLEECRLAILSRDFERFARVVEVDSNLMHAVMLTSTPPLLYWLPATLEIMHNVRQWRQSGLPACYTIDAGPNVHVITLSDWAAQVTERLAEIPGVLQVLQARPGGPARLEVE